MAVFLRNQKNVTKTPSPYPAPTPLRPPHERTRVLRVTTTTTTDDDDDNNNNNNDDYDDVDVDDYDDDGGGNDCARGRRATEATATPNRRRSSFIPLDIYLRIERHPKSYALFCFFLSFSHAASCPNIPPRTLLTTL